MYGTQATHVGGQQASQRTGGNEAVCSQESWATTGLGTQGGSFFSFSPTLSDPTLKQSLPQGVPRAPVYLGQPFSGLFKVPPTDQVTASITAVL